LGRDHYHLAQRRNQCALRRARAPDVDTHGHRARNRAIALAHNDGGALRRAAGRCRAEVRIRVRAQKPRHANDANTSWRLHVGDHNEPERSAPGWRLLYRPGERNPRRNQVAACCEGSAGLRYRVEDGRIMNDKRLIEVAFPLKQTSIDSVHEKNVRHGHISTLHIWPARRPLAASRAALIATLPPDPGDKEKRDDLLRRLGGVLKKTTKKTKMPNGRIEEIEAWETEGGVLRWGRETSPDLEWFRQEIRKAYGGRAPRVLDPFAGGGAIPLEAMRLGCEVTAIDINPVAWFILKC